jgi:Yos1-like
MILNRKRFLAQYGLDEMNMNGTAQSYHPLMAQIASLLFAVQYLKVPVVIANLITIVFEVIFGG